MAGRSAIPLWVQDTDSRELHGIAFRFNRERTSGDLSPQQEWLYDAVIEELEHRRKNLRWPERRCSCALCIGPFDL